MLNRYNKKGVLIVKEIRAMMIGAHPDDNDFRCGGLALKYARAGHKVKFLSLCNGDGGHQTMGPEEIRVRRRKESLAVAEFAGIEYDVWEDSHDCELMATLENRARLVREIREFNPDIIFTCRPNDYHADHRNTAILVQDASYLLTVPNYCPEVKAMRDMPVILYVYDRFKNPSFEGDIMVDIDDVIDDKFKMFDLHESQVYEWLPYTVFDHEDVPEGAEARLEWLHGPRVPRDGSPIDFEAIKKAKQAGQSEYRQAEPALMFRESLIKRYGKERGSKVVFAEAYSVCEYGNPMNDELIPF